MAFAGVRALVTGASGFIGARLTARLVERGAVVAAQFLPGEDEALAGVGGPLERCPVDLRDQEAVHHLVAEAAPQVVFHLAAAGVSQPFLPIEEALSVNLYGALHLLRAVSTAAPGACVVIARTVGERTNLNPYAASKSAAWAVAEMFCRTRGVPLVGLMLYQVYGPGQPARALIPSAVRAALAGEDFAMTHGRQIRDWVHVDDVVEAFTVAAQSAQAAQTSQTAPCVAGRSFEVGTGHGTALKDVVGSIWQITGAAGEIKLGALTARPGEVLLQTADPSPAEEALGWRAQVTLEDGLRRTIEALRGAA
jgi:nucleoside-diphosphate-sugar epimerase